MARYTSTSKDAVAQVLKNTRRKFIYVSRRPAVCSSSEQRRLPSSDIGIGTPVQPAVSDGDTDVRKRFQRLQGIRTDQPATETSTSSSDPSTAPATDGKKFALLKTAISVIHDLIVKRQAPVAKVSSRMWKTILFSLGCVKSFS